MKDFDEFGVGKIQKELIPDFASAGEIFEKFKNAILLKMPKQRNPRRAFFDFVEFCRFWNFFIFGIKLKNAKNRKIRV